MLRRTTRSEAKEEGVERKRGARWMVVKRMACQGESCSEQESSPADADGGRESRDSSARKGDACP